MAFNPFKVLKSLLIQKENSLNPDKIEIKPNGSAGTTTIIQSSQTTNRTITIPDATDTLATVTQVNTVQTNLDNHINDTTDAHDASAISNVPAGTISATDVQAAVNELDGDIQGHITDSVDAHDASAISNIPAGTIAATDVQAAINELDGDIQGHISDSSDAHDASAISVVPTGNLTSTDVQAGLVEIQTQLDGVETTANSAANKTLSNLTSPTSINQHLLPDADGTRNLGSASLEFGEAHVNQVRSAGDLLLNPVNDIDANNKIIKNVAAPTSALHAVNKEYVDSVAAGLDPKQAVRVATTAPLGGTYATTPSNGRFTGAATSVDSVTLVAGDRVLVKDQVDQKQNGIYVYDGAGQYTRSPDMDGSPASEVSAGNYTFATQGTVNVSSGFVLTGNGIFTLNTDNLVFTQFSGSGGVSRTLDNLLAPTAINQTLLPGTTNSRDLGSTSLKFKDAYLQGSLIVNTQVISEAGNQLTINGASNLILQSSSGGVTLQSSAGQPVAIQIPANSTGTSALNISTGAATGVGAATGNVNISTGNSTQNTGGSIVLTTGTGNAPSTRGNVILNAQSTQVATGALNIQQGQTAVPVASQQSITIPSSGDSEGIVQVTASDSSVRNVLAAGPEGLPQAQNLILNGDAEGKLTSSTSIFVPYATVEAVTFQDAGDTVTLLAHGLQNGQTISFLTIVSTTGISINTLYYVVNAATNTFQVATTPGGAALALTTNGSGTMARGLPLTGTGGSPNVTASVTATTPLSGSKSYLLVKDAVNRQGQGWSIPFTVNQANRARVLSIKFDYMVSSGTFVAGTSTADSDVTVYIYDVTNSQLIQPSSFRLLSNSTTLVDQFQAEFQTSVTGTSYRLIFHCATTSAAAYTLEVDNVVVSPSEYVFGTPISDYTNAGSIILGAVTTAPVKGTTTQDSVRWRRVGSHAEIEYTYFQSAVGSATNGSGDYLVSLPLGLQFDSSIPNYTSAVNLQTDNAAKQALLDTTGSINTQGGLDGPVVAYKYSSNQFRLSLVDYFAASGNWSSSFGQLNSAATIGLRFTIKVPIAGWSSSVQMADSTSTRIVDFAGYLASNTSLTANTTNCPWTTEKDSHAGNSAGVYTVPVAGDYLYSVTWLSNGAASGSVYRNGSIYKKISGVDNVAWRSGSVIIPDCRVGDTLSVRLDTTVTVTGSATISAASVCAISRISGPAQISAVETIAARAFGNPPAANAGNPIILPSVDFDTHSAYSTTTGQFTCPAAGIYRVYGAGEGFGSTGIGLFLRKNNVQQMFMGSTDNFAGTITFQGVTTCNAGDTLHITPNVNADVGSTWVAFERIGNRG